MTLAIYTRIGNLVWRRRRQLKEVGALDATIDVSIPHDPPFSKVTEIRITREEAVPYQLDSPGLSIEESPNFISAHRPYSVNVQAGITPPSQVQLEPMRCDDILEEYAEQESDQYWSNSRTASEVNAATWAYTKYAMLFFVALLVTWVCPLQSCHLNRKY
jgi:hypothetical protein